MAPKLANESITEYPEQTTIHGVKYLLSRSRPVADRIFWILIFVLSISSLGYFVSKIIHTWMENPVMIVAENLPSHIFEIPFPAVTICPQIKVKKNKLDLSNLQNDIKPFAKFSDFLKNDLGKKYIMSSQICRREFQKHTDGKLSPLKDYNDLDYYIKEMPTDWISTLHDMSPTLDDVFDSCVIRQLIEDELLMDPSKENCRRIFSTVVTNEGICFTFNSIRDILREDELQKNFQYHDIISERVGWDPENGYTNALTYPNKAVVRGPTLGYKFVVTANQLDISPFCFPSNVGYKIALHSPSAYPATYENFIPLPFGKEYTIAVIPEIIKTADDLRSFAPDVRNCYFNEERKLKFYTFYNQQNCRLECYANYSTTIFDGPPFSSPRIPNVTNYVLPHKNFGWDMPGYFGMIFEHYKLYEAVFADPTEMQMNLDCNCLPECNAILYKHKIIKSNDEFSLEVADDGTNTTDAKIIKTSFEFVFTESKFIGQKRVRVYTIVSMISDFGGLLGLFMGGSIVSLFELVYFLTIRNCFKPEVVEMPT